MMYLLWWFFLIFKWFYILIWGGKKKVMNCDIPDPRFSALLHDKTYVNNPHSIKWNSPRKITTISRYQLLCVSRWTFTEVTQAMQNYKVSIWTIHHQILWENTNYIPSKSRTASDSYHTQQHNTKYSLYKCTSLSKKRREFNDSY